MHLGQVTLEKAMEAAGDREAVESLRQVLEEATERVEDWRRPARSES